MGALHPWKLNPIANTAVPSTGIGKSSSAFLSSCPFLGFRIPHVPSLMQSGSAQLICFAGEKEESYQLRGQKGRMRNLSPMFQVLEQPDHHPHSDLNKGCCGQVWSRAKRSKEGSGNCDLHHNTVMSSFWYHRAVLGEWQYIISLKKPGGE